MFLKKRVVHLLSGVEVLRAAFGSRVDRAEIGIEAVVESAPMSRTTFTL